MVSSSLRGRIIVAYFIGVGTAVITLLLILSSFVRYGDTYSLLFNSSLFF